MDESKSKKKGGEEWLDSKEYSNFLANRSEIRLLKNKSNKNKSIVEFNRRQEFRSKMELCDKLELDKIEDQELISFKNNILFNKGKKDTNVLGANVGFLAVSYGLLAIVMPLIFETFEPSVPELIINIYRYVVILSLFFVILIIKNMVGKANTQYGHNNILLDHQLKLVEAELERRKSESIESKVQLTSIKYNQIKAQKKKRNKTNKNSNGKNSGV